MAKQRADAHLSEGASEVIVAKRLPAEWVIRKLHPDYGVDISIEVFERISLRIPTMGKFLFVQLKSTSSLDTATIKIRGRVNVEKARDRQDGAIDYEVDIVKYVVDSDTIDNARLMGPSTPLLLFVVDVANDEVYYVCLTDYYDKILEPRGFDCSKQNSVTIHIPKSNRLSDPRSIEVMRFFAARAKLYALFNLAQFQYWESRSFLEDWSNRENLQELEANFRIVERFARRLRAMPIWDRPTIWGPVRHHKDRLDRIIREVDLDVLGRIVDGIKEFRSGDTQGLKPLVEFAQLCVLAWEQFSAVGRIFEDVVREWFLPTALGQLGSGEADTFRKLPDKSPRRAERRSRI